MKVILAVLASVVAAASGDCEACVGGWCHSKQTLLEGFRVSDQMAIDWTNDILYVQINGNWNMAYHLKEHTVRLVQELNTTGMTVDQTTQSLYTAHENTIYKYVEGSKIPETFLPSVYQEANLLIYRDRLYYTDVNPGLNYIENDICYYYETLSMHYIKDFIILNNSRIYFVADADVYFNNNVQGGGSSEAILLPPKHHVNKLSNDIFDNVYFSDASLNVIYKANDHDQIVEYAAYETGSVNQFVFDSNNDVVFHDKTDGSVNRWQREESQCEIEVQSKYIIKKM